MSDEVWKGRAYSGIPKNVGGSIKREHVAAFDVCQGSPCQSHNLGIGTIAGGSAQYARLGPIASKRTMQRLFAEESGMSFSRWRQRARLIYAMQSLAAGESVTNAALEAGYSSTSAFISMFRKQLGTTVCDVGGKPVYRSPAE